MFKFITAALLALAPIATPAYAEKAIVPDQLEKCGAYKNTAPFCDESLETDTRQLQEFQVAMVTPDSKGATEWQKRHREKRRGISFVEVNDKGEKVQAGRPVFHPVARVIAVPPSGVMDDAMLFQGLVARDMSSIMIFFPTEGNFQGWSVYILSSDGKYAFTISGELVKLGGRHQTDDNLTLDVTRLPESRIASTMLVTRGDGSGIIEDLEATFVDHQVVNDRDGSTRIYSGLAGTFIPRSEGGTTTVGMYTNCRALGDRLMERGNLRVDTATIGGALVTGGLSAAPQLITNILAGFRQSCR